jgi:hypothetical protein
MPGTAASLFWIAAVRRGSPLVAGLVPRRLIPEVALLLAFGVVIGPGVLGLAAVGEGLEVLRELGLGMLFLLAGSITSRMAIDRHAIAVWRQHDPRCASAALTHGRAGRRHAGRRIPRRRQR